MPKAADAGASGEWMKIPMAARVLQVGYGVVYLRVLSGQLRSRRAGKGWEVARTDVERLRRELHRSRGAESVRPPAA